MDNFFDITEVEVPVTYPFLNGVVMKFFFRPILDKEEKESRQAFFAKTEEERSHLQHDHNVKMLASLATRLPENVPGFAETYTADNLGEVKIAINHFFSGDNVMKQKLVDDALTLYFTQMQPKEFFRSV